MFRRIRPHGQVKPFNFALTCFITSDGTPEGTDSATCHLVAPFEKTHANGTRIGTTPIREEFVASPPTKLRRTKWHG